MTKMERLSALIWEVASLSSYDFNESLEKKLFDWSFVSFNIFSVICFVKWFSISFIFVKFLLYFNEYFPHIFKDETKVWIFKIIFVLFIVFDIQLNIIFFSLNQLKVVLNSITICLNAIIGRFGQKENIPDFMVSYHLFSQLFQWWPNCPNIRI